MCPGECPGDVSVADDLHQGEGQFLGEGALGLGHLLVGEIVPLAHLPVDPRECGEQVVISAQKEKEKKEKGENKLAATFSGE